MVLSIISLVMGGGGGNVQLRLDVYLSCKTFMKPIAINSRH